MKCKIPGFQTVKGFKHRPKDGVGDGAFSKNEGLLNFSSKTS